MHFRARHKHCSCADDTIPEQDLSANRSCSLAQKRHRGRFRICQIEGDRRLCSHMAAMGVYPGLEAELVCPADGGQCILKVNDSTICLDEDITDKIIVSQL